MFKKPLRISIKFVLLPCVLFNLAFAKAHVPLEETELTEKDTVKTLRTIENSFPFPQ